MAVAQVEVGRPPRAAGCTRTSTMSRRSMCARCRAMATGVMRIAPPIVARDGRRPTRNRRAATAVRRATTGKRAARAGTQLVAHSTTKSNASRARSRRTEAAVGDQQIGSVTTTSTSHRTMTPTRADSSRSRSVVHDTKQVGRTAHALVVNGPKLDRSRGATTATTERGPFTGTARVASTLLTKPPQLVDEARADASQPVTAAAHRAAESDPRTERQAQVAGAASSSTR